MTVPNDSLWFVFASLYEKYGVEDAAIEAYQKIKKPEGRVQATSTWLLAQNRIKALKTAKP